MFALNISLSQRILKLQRNDSLITAQLGNSLCPSQKPSGSIRESDVTHLARPNQIIQRRHHFFSRRKRVPVVQPIEVNVIGVQTTQRRVQRAINIFAPNSAGVGITLFTAKPKLRRQHDSIAVSAFLQEFTDEGFASAVCVTVCCINEISSRIKEAVEDLPRCFLGAAPTPFRAKRHSA